MGGAEACGMIDSTSPSSIRRSLARMPSHCSRIPTRHAVGYGLPRFGGGTPAVVATALFRPLASGSRSAIARELGIRPQDFLSGPRTRDTQMGGDGLTSSRDGQHFCRGTRRSNRPSRSSDMGVHGR